MDTTRITATAPTPPVALIVERDTGFADSLASAFTDAGYLACTAASGQEAFEVVEQLIPDLVVLDLDVPVVSAAEVIGHLRRGAETHGLPILGLSSLSYHAAREAIELGADDCLIKPVTPDDVVDAADVLLDRSLEWLPAKEPEVVA